MTKTKKQSIRNPYAIPAAARKAGAMNKETRLNGNNQQRELLEEMNHIEYNDAVWDGEEDFSCEEEQPCLVQAFFEHEAQKPAHLRATSCMISCPCRRCSPGTL